MSDDMCARCGCELGATYWYLSGRHYCDACGDFMRLDTRPAAARRQAEPLVLEDYGRGHGWFRPVSA